MKHLWVLNKTEHIAIIVYYKEKKKSPSSDDIERTLYFRVINFWLPASCSLSFQALCDKLAGFCCDSTVCCWWGQGREASLCANQVVLCLSQMWVCHLMTMNCFSSLQEVIGPKSSPGQEKQRLIQPKCWFSTHFSLFKSWVFRHFHLLLVLEWKCIFLILSLKYLQEITALEHGVFVQEIILGKKNSRGISLSQWSIQTHSISGVEFEPHVGWRY